MKKYVKDHAFKGRFYGGDLVREVDTDRVFVFSNKETQACNYNPAFERVIEIKPEQDDATDHQEIA